VRDPLALDATLVVFGGTLTLLTGAALYADGARPNVLAVGIGATVTAGCAAAVWWHREQLADAIRWAAEPAETPRERARYVLPLFGLVLARFLVLPLLPPVALHGFAGAMAALTLLGAGRALHRGIRGSHPRR